MKILKNITIFSLIAMFAFSSLLFAKDTKVSNFSMSNFVDSTGTFDGNQIHAYITNNGLILDANVTGDSALEWPKGTGVHSIYASSLWLASKVNGEIRTIVADYTQDMGPGPWGGDPLSAVHRVYKVEKAMLASPLDFDDFQQWPVQYGAPWVDVDGDGVYSPLPLGPDHPEFIGDQVLWFVGNDGDPASKRNFGTSPLDVEIQTTVFGFDRPDVFGDMIFYKQLVINKGENALVDTYLGLWSDPDLGSASDDFVGCDVELGMGYVWNDGEDPYYSPLSTGTPAAGYDFFQGPMVPCEDGEDCTEGAKMFGTRHPGMKNLTMSAFAFYINGDDVYRDPADEDEAYYYLQGLRRDGSAYPVDIAGDAYDQKFVFYGDPTLPHSTSNPVDGNYSKSADRRFLMSVGPWTMAPGDSQEVVFGIFHAAGGGPLESVTYLKEVDKLAQTAYDIDFALPDSPPAPKVSYSSLDKSILLKWDGAAENYIATSQVDLDDDGDPTDFVFQGYNVYQYETAQGAGKKKRIATYDVIDGITEIYDSVFDANLGETINIRTQFGSDSGLQRHLSITKDALNGNSVLITNRNYYFAVTAYGYNPYGIPKTLESSPVYVSVRPEQPNTFTYGETTATSGSAIAADHSGPSGGSVNAIVVDPADLTGDSYSLTFDDYLNGQAAVNWTLTNTTTGEVLVANNPVVGGVNTLTGVELGPGATPIVDGFQLEVNGPQPSTIISVSEWTAGWKENNQLRDPAVSYVPWLSLGLTGMITENRAGDINLPYGTTPSDRDFDRFDIWQADDLEIDFSRASLAWDYPTDTVNGYVPFTIYRHNFASGEKEVLFAAYYDALKDNTYDISRTSTGIPHWTGGYLHAPSYDPVYGYVAFDTDGDGVRDFYDLTDADGDGINDSDARYIAENDAFDSGGCGWAAWDPGYNPDHWNQEGGCPGAYAFNGAYIDIPFLTATQFTDYWDESGPNPDPDTGGVLPTDAGIAVGHYNAKKWTGASSIVFETDKPNSSKDSYSFNTEGLGVIVNDYDPDRIKVWPNPYYGYNPEERDALDRRLMFTHLPTEGPATIRIFALDGTLVRTIHHNDTGSQHNSWDLKNNFEIPVASGMYIAHVETQKGEKVLKLAVIQPEQRLDVY